MANIFIEPTFASEADRLTFLSRLWGVPLTAQDALDFAAHIAEKPGGEREPTETEREHDNKRLAWLDAHHARRAFYVLGKWHDYRLGKVKPQAEAWLATRPNPNRNQARQAVLLQLMDKFADRLLLIDAAADLLPLVTGLVW